MLFDLDATPVKRLKSNTYIHRVLTSGPYLMKITVLTVGPHLQFVLFSLNDFSRMLELKSKAVFSFSTSFWF
jgi:hypothetical protein